MRTEERTAGRHEQDELEAYAARAVERYRQEQKARRRQRQAEGIAAAKARGVRFGRPESPIPPNFGEIVEAWEKKAITLEVVLRICNMCESTFHRRLKEYRQECGIKK